MPDVTPASYRDIQDAYEELQRQGHPEVAKMSMHDYADALNKQTNSNAYDAGLNPNLIKDASAGIDRALDASGITGLGDTVGRSLGGLISPHAADLGGNFGKGLVRPVLSGLAGTALGAAIGSFVGPEGTVAGAAAGLEESGAAQLAANAWRLFGNNVGFGADAALETYTDTDSKTAAAAAGGLGYLMHGFGKVGETAAAHFVGTKLGGTLVAPGIRATTPGLMPTLAEMATEKFGLTAGYVVNSELTRQAVNVAMGRGLTLPTTEEALMEIASAGAPLILGAAHDAMNVKGALDPLRTHERSLSEAIRIQQTAQRIATDTLKIDVKKEAVAAETTLAKTKSADAQRAGALNPTEEEMSGQVLNDEDQAAYADAYLHTYEQTESFAGTPIKDMGVTKGPVVASVPETPAATTTPEASAAPESAPTNRKEPGAEQVASQPVVESVKVEAPSQQVPTGESLTKVPEPVKRDIAKVPQPATLQSIIDKAALLNRSDKTPTLENFTQVVHWYTETFKQMADHPDLRDQIAMPVMNDEYFQDRVNHLMSKEGGSMKSLEALNMVLQTAKNDLATALKKFTKMKPIREQAIAEQNAKLAKENEAKFQAAEGAKPVVEAAETPKQQLASQFVAEQSQPGGEFAEEIVSALDGTKDTPMNVLVAIERYIRQTQLNRSPDAREALRTITEAQKVLGRRYTQAELNQLLEGMDSKDAENIRFLFNKPAGSLWNANGEISQNGKLHLLLKEDPNDSELGQWQMTLAKYLRASLGKEKVEQKGTVSLDKQHGEGGESTLANVASTEDLQKLAEERHADPVAQQASVELARQRIAAVQAMIQQLAALTDEELNRVLTNARMQVVSISNLANFRARLQTFFIGLQREPHELAPFNKSTKPLTVTVRGKKVPLPPGLSGWLKNGENGSHTAWQVDPTGAGKHMERCLVFYQEYMTLDSEGMPVISEKYAKGVQAETPVAEPPLDTDKSGFAAKRVEKAGKPVAEIDSSKWNDVQKRSATMFARPDVDNQLALGAHAWFSTYLMKLGVDPATPMFARYRDSMVRMALLFPQIDKARIGEIAAESGDLSKVGPAAGVMYSKYGLGTTGQFDHLKRFVAILGEKFSAPWVGTFLHSMTVAHEFNHVLFSAYREQELSPELTAKLTAAVEIVKNMSSDDRSTLLHTLKDFMLPREIKEANSREAMEIMQRINGSIRYGVDGGVRKVGDIDNPEEFLSVMFEFLGAGLANPGKSTANLKNFERLRQLLPDRLREFQEGYHTNLLQYTKALTGFMNEYTPGLGDKYSQIAETYSQLARTPVEVDAAMQAMARLQSFDPANFAMMAADAQAPESHLTGAGTDKYTATFAKDAEMFYGVKLVGRPLASAPNMPEALKTARKMLLPDPRLAPLYGHNPGFWSLFTPLAQFAERFPVMRPLADTLLGYEGMVNSGNAVVLAPFAAQTKDGKVVRTENTVAMKRLVENTTTRKALNALLLWANANKTVIEDSHIAKLAPQLTANQRAVTLDTITALRTAMQASGANTIQASFHVTGHTLGSFVTLAERGMTSKTGEQIGLNLMKALVGMRSKDPATVMQSQELLGGVKMQLSPATWTNVYQMGLKLAERHAMLIENLTQQPWYTPETRPGEYGMYYETNGKPGFTSFKSESEAANAADAYAKRTGVTGVRVINPYLKKETGQMYSEAAVQHFVDLEQTAFLAAREHFASDPDGQAKLDEFSKLYMPGREILHELASRGMRRNMQERKFVAGREDIDMLSNALNYITSMTRSNARNYIRSKTLLQSQDPTLVNEPRLKTMFFDHMNNVLNPPSTPFSGLKQLVTMYYIGGNVSSAALQVLQPIQSTLPHLTRNGVGIVKGMGYFADACKTLFSAYGQGKGIVGDPMLKGALDKAVLNRVVGFQNIMSQFEHFDDAFVSRIKNFAEDSGDGSMSPSKLLGNVSYQTTRIMSYMFNKANEHNSRVAFIAGFNAARDQGAKLGLVGKDLSDHAYAEAMRTTQVTQLTGGTADRPLGFGKLGGMYGTAGTMYALNHYNFSMVSMMARYGMEALGRTGLQGGELHAARKAFGQAMVTQFVLAGAMGLPFAGAAVALLEDMFPNLQLNRDMRTAISSLAGDDHAMGGFLADASLKGLATAMSPVDLSGRLGLSAVTGSDPYYGFEAKDLLGAPGSMLMNMMKGVQQITSGDPSGVSKLMPTALGNMYKAAHEGGVQKNSAGQPIFSPTDAQRVLMAIGLRPKDLSHAKEEASMDSRNQTIASRQLSQWYAKQEQALSDGDFAGVKAALYQRAQEDDTFSPVVALKRIAAGVQKSHLVQSPSDTGSAAQQRAREQIGQTFGQPTTSQTQPTQVEQLLQRSQLERAVGLPGAGQVLPAELSKAKLMDYLMQTYHLDDGQARALLSQLSQQKNPSFRSFHPGAVNPLQALTAPTGQQ